jgi:hypothetical protein
LINLLFSQGQFILKEISMNKIFYVLAALATIAIAAPAVAHDHEGMHHHMDRGMEMHRHHHHHWLRHLMHREGM